MSSVKTTKALQTRGGNGKDIGGIGNRLAQEKEGKNEKETKRAPQGKNTDRKQDSFQTRKTAKVRAI